MTSLTLLFSILVLAGVLLIYPLSSRFAPSQKKNLIPLGIGLFHIGLYGLLWLHTIWVVPVSLFLVEGGLVIIGDPLHLLNPNLYKTARLAGTLSIALGVVISLSFFTLFPYWLWALPAVGYLLAYLVPPLQKYKKLIFILSTLIVCLYLIIIGERVYHHFYKTPSTTQITQTPPASESMSPSTEIAPVPEEALPSPATDPLSSAMREVDTRLKALEEENLQLKNEVNQLRQENENLKETINDLKKLINQVD